MAAVAKCQHQINGNENKSEFPCKVALLSDMSEANLTSERTVEYWNPPGLNCCVPVEIETGFIMFDFNILCDLIRCVNTLHKAVVLQF